MKAEDRYRATAAASLPPAKGWKVIHVEGITVSNAPQIPATGLCVQYKTALALPGRELNALRTCMVLALCVTRVVLAARSRMMQAVINLQGR